MKLCLFLKCHYKVLIHTYYILFFYIITPTDILPCIYSIGFYAFQSVLLATIIVIAVLLSLVRETYIYHSIVSLTCIFFFIILKHVMLVHIFTPFSISS